MHALDKTFSFTILYLKLLIQYYETKRFPTFKLCFQCMKMNIYLAAFIKTKHPIRQRELPYLFCIRILKRGHHKLISLKTSSVNLTNKNLTNWLLFNLDQDSHFLFLYHSHKIGLVCRSFKSLLLHLFF